MCFASQTADISQVSLERDEEWIGLGRKVYERRCAGCHGVEGDGNGPAATFTYRDRPRNFNQAVFKFRSTGSDSLPTDGDMLRTLVRGVRGTSMPAWHMLPEKERQAVVQYIKYELAVDRSDPEDPYVIFEEEEPEEPVYIARAPEPDEDMIAEGQEIWQQAKCWECHGETGKGDGSKSAGLKDDNKFSIWPADLTTGQFKSGPSVRDMFRTISNGLSGSPMPSYSDSFDEDERWALAYYVMSLSSFTDPLSHEPLLIDDADREALKRSRTSSQTVRRRLQAGEGCCSHQFALWRQRLGEAARHGGHRRCQCRWLGHSGWLDHSGNHSALAGHAMLEHALLQFLVAAFMSLGGVCVFIWAVLSGQFNEIEEPKHRVFEMERKRS